MTYIEYLKKEIKSGNPIFLLSLSATKEEILNADADELTKIINERPLNTSDGKPCHCYCINCGTHEGGLNPERQVIEHIFKDGQFTLNWDMDTEIGSPAFGKRYMGEVIAWMPKPKPYRP